MDLKKIWTLLKTAFQEFQRDKATQLAAALSYYTAISIAPMLVFLILILGFVLGGDTASQELMTRLEGVLGDQGSAFIRTIIENADQPRTGSIAGILSLLILIWGATNVFSHLQDTMNIVWDVKPKPSAGILDTLRRRLLSFTLVLGIGFLLMVSLVLSAALSVMVNSLSGVLPGLDLIWQILEFVISLAVMALLFAAIFKILPDVEIAWRDVWLGAGLTALLFTIGETVLSIYISRTAPGSSYGAAGSVIVFLLWVYYSAIILFFGAEITQVYASRFGQGVEPSEHAVFEDRSLRQADQT